MRKNWKLAALGALVLLLAGSAIADYNVQDHGTHYQNARTGARVNSTGSAMVEAVNAPQDFAVFEPAWLSTVLTARLAGGLPPAPAFLQDSTAAVDVRGANGLAIMAYPTFDDSVSAVALAIQYRWHYSTTVDSQSTFIEMGTRRFPMTAVATVGVNSPVSAAVRDSIGSLVWIPATSTGLSRYSVGAAAVANVDSLATPDEEVLILTNVSGVNRGRMIRITPPNGPSGGSAGPYLSVRVRYLNGYNASGVAWGNGVSGLEPQMRLRLDLVGWR